MSDWSVCPEPPARFENLIASNLLKYCHAHEETTGDAMEIRCSRDSHGRELDFVVVRDKKAGLGRAMQDGPRIAEQEHLAFLREGEHPLVRSSPHGNEGWRGPGVKSPHGENHRPRVPLGDGDHQPDGRAFDSSVPAAWCVRCSRLTLLRRERGFAATFSLFQLFQLSQMPSLSSPFSDQKATHSVSSAKIYVQVDCLRRWLNKEASKNPLFHSPL